MNKLTYVNLSDVFKDSYEDVRDMLGDFDVAIDGDAIVLFTYEDLLRILSDAVDTMEEDDEFLKETHKILESYDMGKAEYINVGF